MGAVRWTDRYPERRSTRPSRGRRDKAVER